MRQSRAATTTPLFASASLNRASDVRSWLHQAPPCRSIISGNGPAPFGLNRRSSSGLPPWLRYSTSSTVNSCAGRDGVGLLTALMAVIRYPPRDRHKSRPQEGWGRRKQLGTRARAREGQATSTPTVVGR